MFRFRAQYNLLSHSRAGYLAASEVRGQALSGTDVPGYRVSLYSPRQLAEDLLNWMIWEEKTGQMRSIRKIFGDNLTFNSISFEETLQLQNGNIRAHP
ncbi:hypothetical protein M433DRAFT_252980 [Acidomyces richmondensis BFW]|nr:MAG: hypothetical protein FE78DRAFT_397789 [Acidomyces sp. 'richmondensis']KYG45495.1 hypothetical protein M433DRAFT_252980 [Acidomyces richmondensis BFW]